MGEFGVLNWTILVVYILGNLVLGFYLSKKVHTAEDYYLGSRATPCAGVFRTDPVIRVWV